MMKKNYLMPQVEDVKLDPTMVTFGNAASLSMGEPAEEGDHGE